MELLDALEALVKNPFICQDFKNSFYTNELVELFKNSDNQKIRELISGKKYFSDMSHVIAF